MKRMIALFSLVTPLFAANALTTNVWTNGSGDFLFNTPGNWQSGNPPTNGEFLSFPSGTCATNDIAGLEVSGLLIGTSSTFTLEGEGLFLLAEARIVKASGDLTFKNGFEFQAGDHVFEVNGALTLDGALSGPGNFEVVCEMTKTLNITPNNDSFTGDIWATNSCLTLNGYYNYYITGKDNNVHIRRMSINKNGARLHSNVFVYESTGNQNTPGIYDYCGDTGIYGDLTFYGGTRFRRSNTGNAFFVNGKLHLAANFMPQPGSTGVKFAFNDIVSGKGFYTTGSNVSGTYTFNAAGNTFEYFELHEGGGNVVFAKPDSMPHGMYFLFGVNTGSLTVSGDQTCRDIRSEAWNASRTFYVTSTVPSKITMTGNWDRNFAGALLGDLSLVWSPTSNKRYGLTSQSSVNTMTGSLEVEAGTMVLTAGQSYPDLSEIVVSGTAKMTIPAGVSINPNLKKITIGPNARLELAEGVALTPDLFYVGGEKMWAKETYTGIDGAADAKQIEQIVGAGTVTPRKGRSGLCILLK